MIMNNLTQQIPYTLYKRPMPNTKDTQNIVRYLHSIGIEFRPHMIVERIYPIEVTDLPAISVPSMTGRDYIAIGQKEVLQFYNDVLQCKNIEQVAKEWAQNNPDYRIRK